MKASELRIGNFVKGKEMNVCWTVEAIDSNSIFSFGKWRSLDAFEPIPLTEEFLLKFGFVSSMPYEFFTKWTFQNNNSRIKGWVLFFFNGKICRRYLGKKNSIYWNKIKIHHVHQLQNLYYALTGKELTLKNQEK
jgi:hypothetical protein